MSSPLTPPYITHAGNYPLYLNNAPVVQSLQALQGNVNLTSPDSSITITSSGQNIQLVASGSGVQSVSAGTGGVSITGTATNPIVNIPDLVQSVSAGTGGVSITGTATNPIVNIPDLVQSVSAGTGGVSITGTATNPIVNVPVIPDSTLVISDYTSTAGTLALTGTFVAQGSTTLTTTQNSAPINVWGNLNVLDGGSGAVIEARLVIGTTPQQVGPTVSITMTNGHFGTIPLIYKGTGPAVAGNVNILLQARVASASASRVSAQVMAIGQMQNA